MKFKRGIADRFIDWFDEWGFVAGVTLAIIIVLTSIGVLIYRDVDGRRAECHRAGGHMIVVQDVEVCVDHDNRVLIL